MKSLLLTLLTLIGTLPSILAQSSGSAEPREPLLPNAPARASWSIAFRYVGDEKPASPETPPRHLGEVPRTILVTKVNDLCLEQILLATGKEVERWDFAGTQFLSDTGGSVFLVAPPSDESPNPDYRDRSRSDFPELGWISMEKYRGVKTFQGKSAFLFETEQGGKKLSAYLALEDQWPIMFSDGTSTRVYTASPPPTGPLLPPSSFLSAYNRHKQAMEALKYRPGAP